MHGDLLSRGLALFNTQAFFDAHEALEDVWREAPRHSPLRQHLQGLVQIAVAFHHQSTGNRVGAQSVLERAVGNVQGAQESFPDLDLKGLLADLEPWRAFLASDAANGQAPEMPKIAFRDEART